MDRVEGGCQHALHEHRDLSKNKKVISKRNRGSSFDYVTYDLKKSK